MYEGCLFCNSHCVAKGTDHMQAVHGMALLTADGPAIGPEIRDLASAPMHSSVVKLS